VSRFSNESLERANHKLEFISVSINQQRDASLDITRNVGQTAVMDSQSNAVVKRTVSAVKSLEDMAGQLNKAIGRFRV
jgi:methyl-accepting chemotaxis protein